jgi:hypothetical protein
VVECAAVEVEEGNEAALKKELTSLTVSKVVALMLEGSGRRVLELL